MKAITQLLLQKRFTDSSLFLLSTMSASSRAARHIVHGWVTLVFCVDWVEKDKLTWAECVFCVLRQRQTVTTEQLGGDLN